MNHINTIIRTRINNDLIRPYHILVTGSSGFLGSKTVVELSKYGHQVCGLDIRPPLAGLAWLEMDARLFLPRLPLAGSNSLIKLPVNFVQADVSEKNDLSKLNCQVQKYGPFDFIINYAAYWNYQRGNVDLYCKNNIIGAKNLYELAKKHNTKKIIFASSVEVLPSIINNLNNPINNYKDLTTYSNKVHVHPYGWSKAVTEKFLIENSLIESNPSIAIVRIGGVFSDWCELPPLSWLINRWSKCNFTGQIIPGKGLTGIPFVHRDDLVKLMNLIIDKHQILNQQNIFMAAPNLLSTTHNQLFPIIRKELGLSTDPIKLNANVVKLGLLAEKLVGLCPSEHFWMFKHIDTNNLDCYNLYHAQELLAWQPSNNLLIENSLPDMLERFKNQRDVWNYKQSQRENHNYVYTD